MKRLTRNQVKWYEVRAALAPFAVFLFPPLGLACAMLSMTYLPKLVEGQEPALQEAVSRGSFFIGAFPVMLFVFWLIHRLRACPSCGASPPFVGARRSRMKCCAACHQPITLAEYDARNSGGDVEAGTAPPEPVLDDGITRVSNAEVRRFQARFRSARWLGLILFAASAVVFVVTTSLEDSGAAHSRLLNLQLYFFAPALLIYTCFALPRSRCPHCGSRKLFLQAMSPIVKLDACPACGGPLKPNPDIPEIQQEENVPYGRK